ncbi:MAG: hypothetical protein FGM23_05990 [Alphaproteobacteria bacterium]|nr:hypothetical protein [Alphaproteobacteria bacterium]
MSGLLQAMRQAQELEDIAAANLGNSKIQSSGLTIADAQFEIACEFLPPPDSENTVVPDIRIRLLNSNNSQSTKLAASGMRNMYNRLFGSINSKTSEQVISKIRFRLVSNTLVADEIKD